ncbi:MAG: potassium channel protein [bacterium]|nr:MAG: potassium channel protein [bacterium]
MQRIIIAVILLCCVVTIGTVGYILIQQWNLLDSLYMTIITIGTVGFHEVKQLSHSGRIFTIALIIFGIGIGSYTIANLSAFIIEGHIQNLFKGRKMEKQINQLNNHIIVCGYGSTGLETIDELARAKKQFVVIENNENKVEELKKHGHLVLNGDATDDEILVRAGVVRAKGLIATLSNDADNVYVVLTARGMNPDLRIVARAIDQLSCKKLIRAGADKVVSPYSIAGHRMARLLLSPGIVDFLEVMIQSEELELKIEEVKLIKGSLLENKQLRESNIKSETDGAMVIGINKKGERIVVNPPGNTLLEDEDILYVLGNDSQIEKLKQLAEVS